jgi:class 3 adenylate cyclase
MTATRRLAAILAADVAGYSRLIGDDEEGTLNRLRSIRADVTDPKISKHRGRIVKTTGDGLLVEFTSVVDALRCASEWQAGMAERSAAVPSGDRIEFRIGVHQGDIVVEDDDIFGDGVNVAARLEGLADPGGICVSARVQEDVAGRLDLTFDDIGEQSLKNIARPVRVYRVRLATAENTPKVTPTESGPALTLPDKPSTAACLSVASVTHATRAPPVGLGRWVRIASAGPSPWRNCVVPVQGHPPLPVVRGPPRSRLGMLDYRLTEAR